MAGARRGGLFSRERVHGGRLPDFLVPARSIGLPELVLVRQVPAGRRGGCICRHVLSHGLAARTRGFLLGVAPSTLAGALGSRGSSSRVCGCSLAATSTGRRLGCLFAGSAQV